ncbi:hypothetical protein CCHL11_02782 [Colletotrichum chlorophyti]|uniref:BTB domain-containing protein n=1 Tax=Colletotrichum chlorophyti TaxID=708187 RepID=A0A1Q8S341_9PEZI|nr:hypothetical protein CCHL11_02782 [Colletotrichum chlorophyti]
MNKPIEQNPLWQNYGEITILDRYGDLYLHVGADVEPLTKTYLICSKALSRASVVFEKMLYGGFSESEATSGDHAWTVDLPEDRSEPLELMLHITHGHFNLVPQKLQLTQLHRFLVLADKYDVLAIARPWAHGWMEAVKSSTLDPLLLAVAYQMGDLHTFKQMSLVIATSSHVDDDKDLVFGSSGQNKEISPRKLRDIDHLMPDGLVHDLALTRETLLVALIDPYIDLYRRLKDGRRLCKWSKDDSEICDSLLLGSLIRSFAAHGFDITAIDPVESYGGSALKLHSITLGLHLRTVTHYEPSSYSFSFSTTCQKVLESISSGAISLPLPENRQSLEPKYDKYIRKQASKTGLPLM